MPATVAAGLLATLASNAMADAKAQAANETERQNMFLQNTLNRRNNVLAYSDQVQGAKMAGLNPAMLNGATPNVAAPVTKANAHVAENVEIDPATLLLDAQRRNVDADTEQKEAMTDKLKGVDTENVKADTALKTAQKLLGEANKDKVDAETTRIRNENDAFEAENSMLADFGTVMAEKWKNSDWFKKLGPDSQRTIEAMADGSIPLTVGGLRAINGSIAAQKNLSDADRALVDNAFANAITEGMFKDPKVMDALKQMPKANIDNVKASTAKAIADSKVLNLDYNWNKDKYNAYKVNDPDYTYSQYMKDPSNENLARWIVATVNDKLNKVTERMAPAAAGGYTAGKGMSQAAKETKGATPIGPLKNLMADPDDPHGVHKMFQRAAQHKGPYGERGHH